MGFRLYGEDHPMIIKTNCLACGKRNAIKTEVIFVPGDCILKTRKGCHKCGHHPDKPTPTPKPTGG